jgi:hypothetical protein
MKNYFSENQNPVFTVRSAVNIEVGCFVHILQGVVKYAGPQSD